MERKKETPQIITHSVGMHGLRREVRLMTLQKVYTLKIRLTINNQTIGEAGPRTYTEDFDPIYEIFIAPTEVLTPDNKSYIYIAFDYCPRRDERLIVRLSEKFYTTHFDEKISRS